MVPHVPAQFLSHVLRNFIEVYERLRFRNHIDCHCSVFIVVLFLSHVLRNFIEVRTSDDRHSVRVTHIPEPCAQELH